MAKKSLNLRKSSSKSLRKTKALHERKTRNRTNTRVSGIKKLVEGRVVNTATGGGSTAVRSRRSGSKMRRSRSGRESALYRKKQSRKAGVKVRTLVRTQGRSPIRVTKVAASGGVLNAAKLETGRKFRDDRPHLLNKLDVFNCRHDIYEMLERIEPITVVTKETVEEYYNNDDGVIKNTTLGQRNQFALKAQDVADNVYAENTLHTFLSTCQDKYGSKPETKRMKAVQLRIVTKETLENYFRNNDGVIKKTMPEERERYVLEAEKTANEVYSNDTLKIFLSTCQRKYGSEPETRVITLFIPTYVRATLDPKSGKYILSNVHEPAKTETPQSTQHVFKRFKVSFTNETIGLTLVTVGWPAGQSVQLDNGEIIDGGDTCRITAFAEPLTNNLVDGSVPLRRDEKIETDMDDIYVPTEKPDSDGDRQEKLRVGDLLITLNGTRVNDCTEVQDTLKSHSRPVVLEFLRLPESRTT